MEDPVQDVDLTASFVRARQAEIRGRQTLRAPVAAGQMAMLAKAPYPTVRDAVIARLTFAEGLGPLLSNVPPFAKAYAQRSRLWTSNARPAKAIPTVRSNPHIGQIVARVRTSIVCTIMEIWSFSFLPRS
jgi:hypothetical protein